MSSAQHKCQGGRGETLQPLLPTSHSLSSPQKEAWCCLPGSQGAASFPCQEGSHGRARSPLDAFGHLLGINITGQQGTHCASSLKLEEEAKTNQLKHRGHEASSSFTSLLPLKKNNSSL